ncbi:anti-sigma factor [Bacteroides xylanisolvens]|nr:anti-sigma factor [Bacteroides xylanisolvens]
MENCLNKYFADEFTSDEKTEFLIEVENNERLKEEFIENQTLLALVDWISPNMKIIKKLSNINYMNLCVEWSNTKINRFRIP